uniref:Uncharacterized protein n=1 Tax=Ditylenchus dipsaci TaxID=166011 RepID=A0A915DKH7_9BILA
MTLNTNEPMCTNSSGSTIVLKHDSLLIQHDWNEVKNDFINVIKTEGSIESGLNDAKIEKLSTQKIRVKYADYEEKLFIAPSVELKSLHNASINSIDLSPSGNLIASGDSEGVLKIWNARTGEVQRNYLGHIMDINKCRFFPSGMQVASCGLDMTVRIWSLSGGGELNDLSNPNVLKGHTRSVLDLVIVDGGEILVSVGKDGTTRHWDCISGKNLQTLSLDLGSLNAVAVKDTSTIAYGSETGRVVIYDLKTSENVFTFAIGASCTSLYFWGDFLYCGTENGEIHCFSTSKRQAHSVLKTSNGKVTEMSSCSLGLLASFNDGTLVVFPLPLTAANALVEFTGSDVDPILDFTHSEDVLFSACRDKTIRKYHLK